MFWYITTTTTVIIGLVQRRRSALKNGGQDEEGAWETEVPQWDQRAKPGRGLGMKSPRN